MRHRIHASRCLPLALLVALLLAPPALAATIASVSIVKNGGNTADFFDNLGGEASAAQSTVAVSSQSSSAFTTRYAAVVSADRGGDESSAGTTTQNFTGDFSITLNVTASAGNTWAMTLEVLRVGAQTIISDGSGNASVALSALTGGESGAGSITSGSLSLGAVTTLNNSGTGGTPSQNQPFGPTTAFSQTTTAVLSGVGTGFAQAVTLNFGFTASASSVDPNGGSVQGDEAALRMGLNSALSSFSADNYPGTGGRVMVDDGIMVSLLLLTESPEPNTALLMGLGLGLLARRARQRRRG
jgi:hypothetical protein